MTRPPKRPYRQPELSEEYISERYFSVPDHIVRSHDDPLPRGQCKEMFASIIDRLASNNLAGALRASELLCKKRPGNSFYLIEYARQLIANNQIAKAISVVDGILSRNENNVEALKMMGFTSMHSNQLSKAIELFGKAVQLSPADSFSQINYHMLRSRLNPQKTSLQKSVQQATIATSIPPRDVHVSQQAVNSWRNLGFKVISLNTEKEKEMLAPRFPCVQFQTCEKTAIQECGKDYQYLDRILDALFADGSDICAIVNADIILKDGYIGWPQILSFAKDSFVFGSRVNVKNVSVNYGTIHEPGFDFFIFPKNYLTQVPRSELVFGQPAWDIFLPAWTQLTDYSSNFCYSPIALHIAHSVNWSRTAQSRYMLRTMALLAPQLAGLISSYKGCADSLRLVTTAFSRILNRLGKGMSRPFFCHDCGIKDFYAPVDPYYWAHATEETLVVF